MKRGETAQNAAKSLRQMILAGQLRNGTPLRQSRLAEELGISRVPLREAFHLLEADGLVEMQANRGAVVRVPSPDEIRQYQEIRSKLEPWLLEIAIPYATEQDFEEMDRLRILTENSNDEEWPACNIAFHFALYRPSNRDYVIEHLRSLHDKCYDRFLLPIHHSRNREKSNREHREILELCRERKIERAVTLLETHILMNGRFVLDFVRSLNRE